MKNFVVSDIHDHYDLLMEALNRNDFDINNVDHRLIVCGDAFYSGPQPGETLIKSPLRGRKSENREIFDIFQDFCIFKGSILPMKGDICPIWA